VEGWWCVMSATSKYIVNLKSARFSIDQFKGSYGNSFNEPDLFPNWSKKFGITFRRKIKHKVKGWYAISLHPYNLIFWDKSPHIAAKLLKDEYLKLRAKDILLTKLMTSRNSNGN
jgi:hypothetical protein